MCSSDLAIGVGRSDLAPFGWPGGRHRRGRQPRTRLGDQRPFPGQPLDLPHAQPDQQQDRRDDRDDQPRPGAGATHIPPPTSPDADMAPDMAPVPGIMFWFIWYMTHSEPVSAITTTISVNISAISVQPFSDLEFMCRK